MGKAIQITKYRCSVCGAEYDAPEDAEKCCVDENIELLQFRVYPNRTKGIPEVSSLCRPKARYDFMEEGAEWVSIDRDEGELVFALVRRKGDKKAVRKLFDLAFRWVEDLQTELQLLGGRLARTEGVELPTDDVEHDNT